MNKLSQSILCLILGVFCITSLSSATQINPTTLENMTDFSDTIVIGMIRSVHGYWEDQKIFTRVIVDVEQYIKNVPGNTGSQIELKVIGGTVGNDTLEVDMAPDFEAGEKAMLFLSKFDGVYVLYGLEYGVYRIRIDPVTGRELIGGPYFNYFRHVDARTNRWISNPDFLMEGEAGPDLNSFKERIESIMK